VSVDSTTLVIPGHGTVFIAPVNTAPPTNPLTAFNIQSDGPTVWKNLGHTSKDNTISFTKDGGEKELLDTFLADSVRSSTSATKWGLDIKALQFDKTNLDLAFNGQINPATGGYSVAAPAPVPTALFLFLQDTTGALGFWIPNTEISLGDAPSIDPTKFLEMPLTATILTASNAVIPAVNGRGSVFEIYKSGLTNSAPTITSVAPAAAVAGSQITITGIGFTGASGAAAVKIGAANASAYTVVSDSTIVATMPAGTAGSAPIVVTNSTGASAAFAYTRGA
jgi:hypothetical protein